MFQRERKKEGKKGKEKREREKAKALPVVTCPPFLSGSLITPTHSLSISHSLTLSSFFSLILSLPLSSSLSYSQSNTFPFTHSLTLKSSSNRVPLIESEWETERKKTERKKESLWVLIIKLSSFTCFKSYLLFFPSSNLYDSNFFLLTQKSSLSKIFSLLKDFSLKNFLPRSEEIFSRLISIQFSDLFTIHKRERQ